MKVLKEFQWNKIESFKQRNPFTISFCYPIDSEPYILKGGSKDIMQYISRIEEPTVVNLTFWRHKHSRNIYKMVGKNSEGIHISRKIKKIPYKNYYQYRVCGWEIYFIDNNKKISIGEYNKIPKSFPKKLKNFILNHKNEQNSLIKKFFYRFIKK